MLDTEAAVRDYLRILGTPEVGSLFLGQLLARMAIGIWPIAMLLQLQQSTGSYAVAGLVTGLMTLGRAAATPLLSRLVGSWGPPLVIGAAGLGSALAAAGLAYADLLQAPDGLVVVVSCVLGTLSGAFMPPVQPVVRSLYPGLLKPDQVSRMFALDAAAQEVIFVLGPILAFGLASAVSPRAAILAGCFATIAGSGWLVFLESLRRMPAAAGRVRLGRVLRHRVVVTGMLTGLLLVAANSAVEAGVVAVFGDHGLVGGLLLALYSVASLIGGLLFARWTSGRSAQARWMLLVAAGLALGPWWTHPGWLGLALFVAGLGVAPVFAAIASSVSGSIAAADSTEAFGWVDTGAIIGASAGFGVAGVVVEAGGGPAALWLAAGFALLGGAVAALGAGVRRVGGLPVRVPPA